LKSHHEDAINAIRSDLSCTYDQLLEEKDRKFVEKEREISNQIYKLEQRFETLQSENLRLKSKLAEHRRQLEQESGDRQARDEQIRTLHWRLEDVERAHSLVQDSLSREIHKAQSDLSAAQDHFSSREKEHLSSIAKVPS